MSPSLEHRIKANNVARFIPMRLIIDEKAIIFLIIMRPLSNDLPSEHLRWRIIIIAWRIVPTTEASSWYILSRCLVGLDGIWWLVSSINLERYFYQPKIYKEMKAFAACLSRPSALLINTRRLSFIELSMKKFIADTILHHLYQEVDTMRALFTAVISNPNGTAITRRKVIDEYVISLHLATSY